MEKSRKLSVYLRDMFALFVMAGLLFLLAHPEKRGRLFSFVFVFTVVSGVLFALIHYKKLIPKVSFRISLPKTLLLIFSILAVALIVLLFYSFPHDLISLTGTRLLVLAVLAGGLGLICAISDCGYNPLAVMTASFLGGGLLYMLVPYLTTIQATPFSLGWSEGSQVYFASLFHSQKLYGQKLPLPVLDPSRYLIQSIPFVFGIRSIFIHRLWQVFLWVGLNAAGAWLIAKKVGSKIAIPTFWLSVFMFLFFFQGPVYYSLFVAVIIVLLGYKRDNPARTLIAVILASIWTGLSRVNWIPLPALLAACLYLFDEPVDIKNWAAYLKKPMVWTVVGVAAAWLSKYAYRFISGEDPEIFDTAFSSPLLWYRMFPNVTYAPGILLGIALVCLPLLILTILFIRKRYKNSVHWLRWLGLGAILAVFLVGGIVVSAKIGGGSNLHNLDAFLVLFVIVSLAILSGHITPESKAEGVPAVNFQKEMSLLLLFAVFVLVSYTFFQASITQSENTQIAETEVAEIQSALNEMKYIPGDVLFITERQLLTTGAIEGVLVVPDYEKVIIMEMAMANNQGYLEIFYQELEENQFKAIILDTLNTSIYDETTGFSDENNSYVSRVVIPILSNYQLAQSWRSGTVNLMIPIGID